MRHLREGDEAILLGAPPSAQHLLDRRPQVVVADEREDAAEEAERLDVRLKERLLRLPLEGHHERRARVAGPHEEEVDLAALAANLDDRLAPVDLGLDPRLVHPRHVHLVDRLAELAPANVVAHRPLGEFGALLVHEALPDPLRGVALLARRGGSVLCA